MHFLLSISCFVFTILGYYSTKFLHGQYNKIWLIPLVSVPVLIVAVLLLLNICALFILVIPALVMPAYSLVGRHGKVRAWEFDAKDMDRPV